MGIAKLDLPRWPEGAEIPPIIHQTFPTRALPAEVLPAVNKLKADHPGWAYRFYDDADIERFIAAEYGPGVLSRYERISPDYGAARADLFRYLLMYRIGGVYLDIKSTTLGPLDDLIAGQRYLLAHWDNGPAGSHPNWGLHEQIRDMPRGELQQWHVIAAPGHPFLRAVLEQVLGAIDHYRPWLHDVGKAGVFNLTGPVAYTRAIAPLIDKQSHRLFDNERELGLVYSALRRDAHHELGGPHYTRTLSSVVAQRGVMRPLAAGYTVYRKARTRVRGVRLG